MIATLTGNLVSAVGNRGVLNVRDVGYEVFAPTRTLDVWGRSEEPVLAHISTQVREDAFKLYGFSTDTDRVGFELLLSVSGVGPKLALACLDALPVVNLQQAVDSQDIPALCKISGIGKRTAQRMVLELQGKFPVEFSPTNPSEQLVTQHRPKASANTLVLALARLGYSKNEITMVERKLPEQGVALDDPISDRLKAALRILYSRK